MRTLVVGAGAIGGFFGARLLQAECDVTFLVRPARAEALAATGLVVRSAAGDVEIGAPPTVTADRLSEPYDLILVSCKAYDLDDAIDAFAPAAGPQTAILPLLNGMRHIDVLRERFGTQRVLGGQCIVSTTLDPKGQILHLSPFAELTFGELDGTLSERVEAIVAQFAPAAFEARASTKIVHEMWEKWVFIATLAGITCLMRAPVGDIVAADGAGLVAKLLDECALIATRAGYRPSGEGLERALATFTAPGSTLMASMTRDIERGAPIEGEHIVGDLVVRAEALRANAPLLHAVATHLRAYEARRAREGSQRKNERNAAYV